MLRTSDYTIFVDLPEHCGGVLLVHGYTAAHDRVSKPVAKYLKSMTSKKTTLSSKPKDSSAQETLSDATLTVLKKRGYLTEKSPEQEHQLVEKLACNIKQQARRKLPGYIIMPTYGCNLRCPYCFQDALRSDPASKKMLKIMDVATVDRLFKAFAAIEERQGVEADSSSTRSFTFFGGEPLLKEARPTIAYFMDKARATTKARFNAISNCTEIEHYADLLGPEGIASIQVTFDGPPSEHDRRRVFPNGAGSFERIADNVSMALAQGAHINARVNVDRSNISQLPELAEEFARRGWHEHERFRASAAPIHGDNGEREKLSSRQVHLQLDQMYEANEVVRAIGRPTHMIKRTMLDVLKKRKHGLACLRPAFCGAHTSMYVFDALGRIFACWERTGDDKEAIGRIDEGGSPAFVNDVESRWRERSVITNEDCKRCRFALFCGGGCAALAEQEHGSYLANRCDGFPQRFQSFAAAAFLEHQGAAQLSH